MTTSELLRMRLRCDSSAPRLARAALSSLSVLEPARDDVLLVASELAANAVRHSGMEATDEFELVAELMPTGVRIAVTDPGHSKKAPRARTAEHRGPGGMGLRVVQAIARRWGAERADGMHVWAELAL